jgi:hypothetical protein
MLREALDAKYVVEVDEKCSISVNHLNVPR